MCIRDRTRLLCTTWVHSFSGHGIDLDAVGAVCRARGVLFIANVSQVLGARPLDVGTAPVDGLVCAGWKWLCGPYATGFCWLRPELRDSLVYNQNYWLSLLTSDDLGQDSLDLTLAEDVGGRRYDVFGTANFFNFAPFAAAGIHVAFRAGSLRISPHVYNTPDDIDRALAALKTL